MSTSERDEVLLQYQDTVAAQTDELSRFQARSSRQLGRRLLRLGDKIDIKEEAMRTVTYFFNYNTVEAILLGCAVLINLFGIMFESEYLTNGSTQEQALTYFTVLVMVGSIFYYSTVFWSEVIATLFPVLACGFLNQENKEKKAEEEANENQNVPDDSNFQIVDMNALKKNV